MTLDGDTQESLKWHLQLTIISVWLTMQRYSDPEMDELFAQAQKEADTEKKRTELFNQAFNKAQDEAIYAVIGNPLELFAYNNSLDKIIAFRKVHTLSITSPGNKRKD